MASRIVWGIISFLVIAPVVALAISWLYPAPTPWQRHVLRDAGLSVELPKPPERVDATPLLSDKVRDNLIRQGSYTYNSSILKAIIVSNTYKVPLDIETSLKLLAESQRAQHGVTDVSYSITRDSPDRATIKGFIQRQGGSLEMEGFAVLSGQTSTGVVAFHLHGSPEAATAAQRFLQSVRFL